jgi:RNA polymerase sigma-70 factor (ECF subfamily)
MGRSMTDSDDDLMLAVRGGSRAAFETLFERYRDAIWRFFRRRVSDPARAEELLQDVFVTILQASTRYEPRSSFRSYLFGIAFNLLHAEHRKSAHAMAPIDDDPPAPGFDPEAALWVRGALATLDTDHCEVVMLREYEGLSYQEIADLLQLPINTVRSRLFRARMQLKEALTAESVLPCEERSGGQGSPPTRRSRQ